MCIILPLLIIYICWPAPSNLYTVYMPEIANENKLLFQRVVWIKVKSKLNQVTVSQNMEDMKLEHPPNFESTKICLWSSKQTPDVKCSDIGAVFKEKCYNWLSCDCSKEMLQIKFKYPNFTTLVL